MSDANELPTGWESITLGSIVDNISTKVLPHALPNAQFIGMDSIAPNSMKPYKFYSFDKLKSAGNKFETGNVLYGRMRPYLNKIFKATFDGVCSGEFIILKCRNNLIAEYLQYILHHQSFVKFACEKTTGDRPRVTFAEISEYPIYLPPLSEQKRIVAKIEELFSSLDKGIENLKIAQEQLKVYRQAVLKSAFEGKLTNKNVKNGKLPEGWTCGTFNDVCIKIGDIDHKMPNEVGISDYPYLSTKNFTDSLKVSFNNVKHISKDDYLQLSKKN